MMFVGSARKNELGTYDVGAKGDQLQKTKEDYSGEVSMQKMYTHNKGWYVIRPISVEHADNIAKKMYRACCNPNVGYSQNDRLAITKTGIDTTTPTNCDCSSLVRQCIKEATGIDVGNFTTGNEREFLKKSGLFLDAFPYTQQTKLYDGDILVTKTRGHTVIVVSGDPRPRANLCYTSYKGMSISIVKALDEMGIDSSKEHRKKIYEANFPDEYKYTATQNTNMLKKLKSGDLCRA